MNAKFKKLCLISICCLLIWSLGIISPAWAAPVSEDQAKQVVQTWLALDSRPLGTDLGTGLKGVQSYKDKDGQPLYYVVNLDPEGLVIVAGDDLVEPLVAFLAQGKYDPSPANPLGALVSRDVVGRVIQVRAKISTSQELGAPNPLAGLAREAQRKWRLLDRKIPPLTTELLQLQNVPLAGLSGPLSDERVAPFTASTWDQEDVSSGFCYNFFTPSHTPSGCVATAMAQVMRFHTYPLTGVGTQSYSINALGNEVQEPLMGGNGAGGAYDWNQMPLTPNNPPATFTERHAIGRLLHDAGAAVHMKYKTNESSANTLDSAEALKNTFFYQNTVKAWLDGNNIPSPLLKLMLNPNLDARCPALLGITGPDGGHAVVADGYGFNAGTLYHHLNMGWGGGQNVWYNLPIIDSNPAFNTVYRVVYNIFPQGTGEVISGRVTNTSGQPVGNARVYLSCPGAPKPFTDTDWRGIYAFAGVPSNTVCNLTVQSSGFASQAFTVTTGKSELSGDWLSVGNQWGIDFVLSPVQEITLNQALDNAELAFGFGGGTAAWSVDTTAYHYGGSSARSGAPNLSSFSGLQTTVTGPKIVAFLWKVSCHANSSLEFYIDSALKDRINGAVDWQRKIFYVPNGAHTVKWVYNQSGQVGGSNCGWLDQVAAITPPVSLGQALDFPILNWTTGGQESWIPQTTTQYRGGSAAQSGDIMDNGASWLQTTVVGPGNLWFHWKVSSEANYDKLTFFLDDAAMDAISGEINWQQKSLLIPVGNHTLKWTYSKDGSTSNGQDCGWVDNVTYAIHLPAALDNPFLNFSTGGNSSWFGQANTFVVGNSAAQNWKIQDNQSSWLSTTVTGPGSLWFRWKVSSEKDYDFLEFSLDDVPQKAISGEVDWQTNTWPILIPAGNHTLKWTYRKDATVSEGQDCGFLDQVLFTMPLGVVLDNTELTFTTGGNSYWFGQSQKSYYGGSAARNYTLMDNQSSWLETWVTGPGTVSFFWAVSSEANFDRLEFAMDGIEMNRISGEVDWQQQTYQVPPGPHLLNWRYFKDYSRSSGADCGWVDKVVFSKGATTSILPLLLGD